MCRYEFWIMIILILVEINLNLIGDGKIFGKKIFYVRMMNCIIMVYRLVMVMYVIKRQVGVFKCLLLNIEKIVSIFLMYLVVKIIEDINFQENGIIGVDL